MGLRRVTLLVAIYLVLDFANPMMPSAVQLVHGSLETVAGCQARGGEAPVLAVTIVPRPPSLDLPEQQPAGGAIRRVVSASSPVPIVFRAPFEPRRTRTSSVDDD